jgi:hypothetical protein
MSTMSTHTTRIATLLGLGLAACTGADADSGDSAGSGARRMATTDGGTWTVTYAPDPDPIPGNAEFALDITVEGAGGAATGATIAVTADMPQHGHGMNQEPVVSGADGTYRADGMLFHMTGDWRLVVDVTGDAGTESAEFTVTCCEVADR